jgi:hypothetical protein
VVEAKTEPEPEPEPSNYWVHMFKKIRDWFR